MPCDSAPVCLDFVLSFLRACFRTASGRVARAPGFSKAMFFRNLGSLSCPRLPLPAACFRASKEGSAAVPSMLFCGCHSPLLKHHGSQQRGFCVTYSMTLEEPASCCDSAKNRELAVSKRAERERWLRGGEPGKAGIVYDIQSLSKKLDTRF